MTGEYLERRRWRDFDFALLGVTVLLLAAGVAAVYSANLQSDSAFLKNLYARQLYWIAFCLIAVVPVLLLDYHSIERMAYPLYFTGLGLLIMVEIIGREGGGAQRWLSFGGFNVQPSEIMKILVIILLARILDERDDTSDMGLKDLVKPALVAAVPFVMVAKQPDLGTATVYLAIFAGMALMTGVERRALGYITASAALILPVSWLMLKPYQKNRILTLLNPEADPMGQGYHIIQSKIAVGSGGLWGKGIFEGTQSKLNFLPEKHTDFIFSVVAEEVGLIGSLILIALFYFLILRILDVSINARDKFGSLAAVGVGVMMSFNFLYNIGMTLGLFPIVGIPLPFISYGGSSLLTNLVGVGLVLNVSLRRFRN
ncbi:MAG: rod shape-determining protein RodA [Candidatus Nitrospinota bacterium M3_3B_026]